MNFGRCKCPLESIEKLSNIINTPNGVLLPGIDTGNKNGATNIIIKR